jgi:hypothetical protein
MPLSKIAIVLALAFLASCSQPQALDEGLAQENLQSAPRELSSEMVGIGTTALNCAIENGLWGPPEQASNRTVAHLTDLGRSLHFSDDVSIGEPGFHGPYTQIRGTFPLQVAKVVKIRDGADASTKTVEVNVGVVIAHACFPAPLPMLGVRRGRISDDLPVTLEFAKYQDDTWHFEKIVH